MSALLKETVRATVFMMVPVVAFLAIVSAVVLFAVPRPVQSPHPSTASEVESPSGAPTLPNTRAAVRPSKI
jgi:hypothetical protein